MPNISVKWKVYFYEIIENDKANVAAEIQTIINEKSRYGSEIECLTPSEKVIFLVDTVEGEINNGGFSQFLFNSSGIFAKEALEALRTIEALRTADLLNQAIMVYGNGPTIERNAEDF